jgi:Bacterial regulatory protein, Fis family
LGGIKKETEKRAITQALELSKGSRKEAARMLNISTRSLQYKMADYEIDRSTGAAVDTPPPETLRKIVSPPPTHGRCRLLVPPHRLVSNADPIF